MKNQKTQIEQKAKSLGFDLVSFHKVELPEKYEEKFKDWVAAGEEGEMKYLTERMKNSPNPNSMLAGAKTVISLAVNYFRGDLRDTSPNPLDPNGQEKPDSGEHFSSGRVALYATTRDYHKIIKSKLKKLAKFIDEEFETETKAFVDTGPILERAYAAEAGLGYIGRNTCLITKEFGSWVFLSEIITTLDLEQESKETKLSCGTCRRCVDICPTKAINEDFSIDARKCISYLTIENRGPIPLEFRDQVGNWIYGCDICQDVCPHNAKAQATKAEDFNEVRIKDRKLDLVEILSIKDDEEFLKLFAGSPLMRAKRRGLIRNACVVAGNSLNKDLLPALERIVEKEEEMLKEHATWAIQKITKG